MNPDTTTRVYKPDDGEEWVPVTSVQFRGDKRNFEIVTITHDNGSKSKVGFFAPPFDFDPTSEKPLRGRPADPLKLRWKYAHMVYEVVRLEKCGGLPHEGAKRKVARAWSTDGHALRTVETALASKLAQHPYMTLRQEAEGELSKYLTALKKLRK